MCFGVTIQRCVHTYIDMDKNNKKMYYIKHYSEFYTYTLPDSLIFAYLVFNMHVIMVLHKMKIIFCENSRLRNLQLFI